MEKNLEDWRAILESRLGLGVHVDKISNGYGVPPHYLLLINGLNEGELVKILEAIWKATAPL